MVVAMLRLNGDVATREWLIIEQPPQLLGRTPFKKSSPRQLLTFGF